MFCALWKELERIENQIEVAKSRAYRAARR